MPAAASLEAGYVDGAWNGLFYVETVIYGLVVAYVLYCLIHFRRRKDGDEGDKIRHSRGWLVETGWVLASTGLTLALAALGAKELRAVIGTPEADIDVEVRAQQFSWEFYYPQLNKYGSKLYLEKGKRHRIILTSKDVVHSFWVPELRLKQDAVPGKIIPLLLTPTVNGEYTLLCSQLCGMQHTDMTSSVAVVDHEDFEKQFAAEF
jgi:cytochrome c oxidase subunit 2